jgi:ornithine carbamoyltransferase
MTDLISLGNWSTDDLLVCLDLASAIKAHPADYAERMRGKALAMLFQKTSTRTRVSFAAGMAQLGGTVIPLDWEVSNFTIGGLSDEVRCLDRYVDVIMARMKEHEDLLEIAEASRVPVINGCCNKYHPCQVLADLLTIREKAGRLRDVHLVYVGVFNNVCNTLLQGCLKLDMNVTMVTPEVNRDALDEQVLAWARRSGRYQETLDLQAAVAEADFLYTDTWVDMEHYLNPKFESEKNLRMAKLLPYQVNRKLLEKTPALVMHCLAAHRGYEIMGDVLDGERSIAFDQAENRLHAQKAVLLTLCPR